MSDRRLARAVHLAGRIRVEGELAAWRPLGVRPRLLWRDDDARAPTQALDRLLALAAHRPLALAVIPDGDLPGLATRLASHPGVTLGQHGIDHVNRRTCAPPSEFAEPPSVEALRGEIAAAEDRMTRAGLSPRFFTPPWNAVDPALPEALGPLGHCVLSAGATEIRRPGLVYASAEVDILSWKRGPRFKGGLRVLSAMARGLNARRRSGDLQRPLGLLTHHLVHDEAAWTFLSETMRWFDAHFDWVRIEDVGVETRSTTLVGAPSPSLAMAHLATV